MTKIKSVEEVIPDESNYGGQEVRDILTQDRQAFEEAIVEAERERIRIAAQNLANETDNYGRVHYTKLIKLLTPTKTDKQTEV